MNEQQPGTDPDRPASLIDRALQAADALVNEAQQRMPPELLNQLRSGQRQLDQRLAKLQAQLGRSATRTEVDRLARRVDELAARLEELGRSAGGRAPRTSRPSGGPARGTERGPRRETSERGPRRETSDRGPRREAREPSERAPRSRGPRASSAPGDKPPRRSTRSSAASPGGARETPPRRAPQRRSRKPPEPPDGGA